MVNLQGCPSCPRCRCSCPSGCTGTTVVSSSWWGSGGGQALARQVVTRVQRGAAWRASAWACLSINNLHEPQKLGYPSIHGCKNTPYGSNWFINGRCYHFWGVRTHGDNYPVPHGNHGDNISMTAPSPPPPTLERQRIAFDVSPSVGALLDHISDVTGVSKAGIVAGALLDALPDLLARADGLKKRHSELSQGKPRK